MPCIRNSLDDYSLDELADLEDQLIDEKLAAGYVECGWCNHWKKQDEECPRCWRQWHSDEESQ